MEAAPEFKNESQEKLAIIATLQGQENQNLRRRLRELSGEVFHQETFSIEHIEKEEMRIEPVKSKRRAKIETPKKGHGPTKQESLEHVDEVYFLDAPDQTCPSCGGGLIEWDGQFEGSDFVDVIEKIYIIKKVKRQKYRCNGKHCDHIETALGRGGRLDLRSDFFKTYKTKLEEDTKIDYKYAQYDSYNNKVGVLTLSFGSHAPVTYTAYSDHTGVIYVRTSAGKDTISCEKQT